MRGRPLINNNHSLSPTTREAAKASEPRHETDADRLEAMNVLCKHGVFKRVADLQLYHGRSNTDGATFAISARYDNRFNPDGVANINQGVSALSTTTDLNIAREFAEVRASRDQHRRGKIASKAEVHRIVSNDPDAVIFDQEMMHAIVTKSSPQERAEVRDAFRQLALPASLEYAPIQLHNMPDADGVRRRIPLDYEKTSREVFPSIPRDFTKQAESLGMIRKGYYGIGDDELQRVANAMGINIDRDALSRRNSMSDLLERGVLEQIAQIGNSYNAVCKCPGQAIEALINGDSAVWIDDDSDYVNRPISLSYVAKWAKANHIVGAAIDVYSATLGKELTTISLFDLSKARTPEQLQSERQERANRLGRLALALTMNSAQAIDVPRGDTLINVLSDELWATPERIINCAREVPLGVPGIGKYWETFSDVFDADAGNWEGYTLGEHTETVLRNFENTYADKLPARLLPIMRLCLVVHDIGKPIAVHNGEKRDQDRYNASWAMVFLAKAGVEQRMAELVIDMITSGKDLAAQAYVSNARSGMNRPDEAKLNKLRNFCLDSLDHYGMKTITDSDVDGMSDLCLMLLTCDAAAYTTMGVTHDANMPGVYYDNYPSFQQSFRSPTGLAGDEVELKSADLLY